MSSPRLLRLETSYKDSSTKGLRSSNNTALHPNSSINSHLLKPIYHSSIHNTNNTNNNGKPYLLPDRPSTSSTTHWK